MWPLLVWWVVNFFFDEHAASMFRVEVIVPLKVTENLVDTIILVTTKRIVSIFLGVRLYGRRRFKILFVFRLPSTRLHKFSRGLVPRNLEWSDDSKLEFGDPLLLKVP